MGLGSLRQGAQKVSQNNTKDKGGRGGYFNKLHVPKLTPALQNLLRPNEDPGTAVILELPAKLYDDVYDTDDQGNWRGTTGAALHVLIHEIQTSKNGKPWRESIVCTAGPNPHAPKPCVGCFQNDAGNKSVGGSRQQWAFNVKHLAPYHEVPLVDRKNGQIVMKKDKPNEPVMVLEACQVGSPSERLFNMENGHFQPCEYCQRNIPLIYGAPKVYVLGKNHFEELLKVNDHLEQTCANCLTRLVKVAFDCATCGNELLNLANTQFVNEQIKQYGESPQQCGCGFTGLPRPIYECGFHPSGMYKVPNGCPQNVEPRPLSIFSTVLYLHKEGDGTQSKLIVSPPIPIQHFRTATGNADLDQWLKLPHLSRTFNLHDMFKPMSTDEQAKKCGVADPYAAQQPQYQQYPAQQPQGVAPGQFVPAQQYGTLQPGYPPQQAFPQQQQPMQGNVAPSFPQQPMQPQMPPGMPFTGRPNFGK